jgi:hypothetical protein
MHESQGADRTPAGLMLRTVAFAVYVLLPTEIPLAASIGAAVKFTVAVTPEEHVVPVTVPFAQ